MRNDRFDSFSDGVGNSGFGLAHQGHQLDLRVSLPMSTDKLVGVDLTHVIHTNEVADAKGGNGGGGGGHGGGGGGGGGGGTSFDPYTAGPSDGSDGYNITITFSGTWTQALHDVFVTAADRLVDLIVGEIPDVTVYGGKGGPKTIDDILISAELGNIDGLYGILGQAGPTSVRTASSLPATAQMKFDIVDVNDMGNDVFSQVVLHEMSHSLGFGSIWDRLGLVSDGEFTGANATSAYHDMGGSGLIAVEQDGGAGTAGSHWDEESYGNELMTGYINDGPNYYSAMSAASFADLGYVTTGDFDGWADSGYVLA
ncbi:MAG TPA: leishmanolysin-related zinc metalloendopeptidase [Sphingomicrobium sp.]|nr:leishmanolysin-related zinc metalloendopeptidase [Sphingomicrobium sp.]